MGNNTCIEEACCQKDEQTTDGQANLEDVVRVKPIEEVQPDLVRQEITRVEEAPPKAAAPQAAPIVQEPPAPEEKAPPQEFIVRLARKPDNSIGLSMTKQGDDMLRIDEVLDGPVRNWNVAHSESMEVVRSGDMIVEINGTRLATEMINMMAATTNSATLSMLIQRDSKSFRIEVSKRAKSKVGVGMTKQGETIKVDKVLDGLISTWNEQNPAAQVCSGDVIVEANGVRGDFEKLVRTISGDKTLDLLIQRGS